MKVQDERALLQLPREERVRLHTLEPSAGGFFSETWRPDKKWEGTCQLLKETINHEFYVHKALFQKYECKLRQNYCYQICLPRKTTQLFRSIAKPDRSFKSS